MSDMIITLCGSLNFAKEILEIKNRLEEMGHEVLIPASITVFSIRNENDAEKLKDGRKKYIDEIKPVYTKKHFKLVEKSDAILVVNIDKKGIKNYIGGATFAEIMVAFYLGKKIFFLNPIPRDEKMSFFVDELECVKPVVLNGNLEMAK
jgi:hypothetical protein